MQKKTFLYLSIIVVLLACDNTKPLHSQEPTAKVDYQHPISFNPSNYVCYQTNNAINIDGQLNEMDWQQATTTNDFVDIEGDLKPKPPLKSNAKLLWNKDYLYIAMIMEEPHIWATLKDRDAVIFQDDAIEVFIDPDGDGHQYCELQVNAFNAIWDLLLSKPYRIGKGPHANTNWNITGLQTAVSLNGTLNKPDDEDEAWTVEMAIPWNAMKKITNTHSPPKNGDQWRMNLSRVDWLMDENENTYKKQIKQNSKKPKQEQYYVWSPQGRVALHQPETWGYVQFTQKRVGEELIFFDPNPEEQIKWALWQLHYQQAAYYKKYKKYATSIRELSKVDVKTPDYQLKLTMENYTEGYQLMAPTVEGNSNWVINEEGQILKKRFSK